MVRMVLNEQLRTVLLSFPRFFQDPSQYHFLPEVGIPARSNPQMSVRGGSSSHILVCLHPPLTFLWDLKECGLDCALGGLDSAPGMVE